MNPITLAAFVDELEKVAQDWAIPDRGTVHELPVKTRSSVWELGVHDHHAKRRGRHFDLRLGEPGTSRAHSWSLPPELPRPGTSTWAIAQPTHRRSYMDFEGELGPGYGEGRVLLHDRDRVEVHDSKPGHLNFSVYRSTGPQDFVLHRIADEKWQLINTTPTQEKLKLPLEKPKYKTIPVERALERGDDYVMSAKIDDAHNLFVLPESGKKIRILSYRPSKKSESGLIEHTHKVPGVHGARVPPGLGNTVVRGGLYAKGKDGKPVDAHVLGGMLNSDVWKSREKQKAHGKLIPVLYDVVRFRGRDMANAPYEEKLKVLQKIVDAIPGLKLPSMARTPEEKAKLLEQIRSGKHPDTSEGVVLWNLKKGEPAVKAKFREEQDVYLRDFFPAEKGSKYEGKAVGGFTYSHTPNGPIVGRVGTGISDALRRAMHEAPERFKGAVAMVSGARLASGGAKHESGAVRAPSFKGFHPDKNADLDLEA